MKETIHDAMTVNRRSPQSTSGSEGEIPVGSVIFSEIARCELVNADPQQDLDDVQQLQVRHQVRRRPVVEANDELIGSVVQRVIALHADGERRGDAIEGIFEVGKMRFLLNDIRGNTHTAHVVARNALT